MKNDLLLNENEGACICGPLNGQRRGFEWDMREYIDGRPQRLNYSRQLVGVNGVCGIVYVFSGATKEQLAQELLETYDVEFD